MYFDDLSKLPDILQLVSTAIVILPTAEIDNFTFPSKFALIIQPDAEKTVITIDQIQQILASSHTQQQQERYFIIKHAELMNESSANAFLKTLEEPNEHYHFILLATETSLLLPTILSRAYLYIYHNPNDKFTPNPEILPYAKRLITATGSNLCQLADDLVKHSQPTARTLALSATAMAIQILTRAYLQTQNAKLPKRLDSLIKLHQALVNNGHVKLQVVAQLC